MIKSKLKFRCRPALGTLVRVGIDVDAHDLAYDRIREVEAIFNFHDPESELSKFNAGEVAVFSSQFTVLRAQALLLRDRSLGAFTPFVDEQRGGIEDHRLDLSGLAKGYAVDEAVKAVLSAHPDSSGWIEAGGEIRWFGDADSDIELRLGVAPNIVKRSLKLSKPAIATSAPSVAESFGETKTSFRKGKSRWPTGTTVCVLADSCMLADGLTKVGLFATPEVLEKFKTEDRVEFLFFDARGELL
jgi:FAD:protein FMN transferase